MAVAPSYGVRKVNENIIHEGRSLIITNLDGVDFEKLPNGTLYINDKTGETKIKLEGRSDWQDYSPLTGSVVPSSEEFETLKQSVASLTALLQRYTKTTDQSFDTLNQAVGTINDLVTKTANFNTVTARQDQQLEEMSERIKEKYDYDDKIQKEKQERLAEFAELNGIVSTYTERISTMQETFKKADQVEAMERKKADDEEKSARTAADSAEQKARIEADTAEQAARIQADTAETKARQALDTQINKALKEETASRTTKDTDLQSQITALDKSLTTEQQNRASEDTRIHDELQKKLDIQSDKLDDQQKQITAAKEDYKASLDEERKTWQESFKTEQDTRDKKDEEIRNDYTAKYESLRLNFDNYEDEQQSNRTHFSTLDTLVSSNQKQIEEEGQIRAKADEGHDTLIRNLRTQVDSDKELLQQEIADRKEQVKTVNQALTNSMGIQEAKLDQEIENRKTQGDDLQSQITSSSAYVKKLVAQAGAECVVSDQVIPPNGEIIVIFQDGQLSPYARSLKVLVLDDEDGSRTKGLYINAEGVCTTAYSDTEYHLFNDNDKTINIRIIYS